MNDSLKPVYDKVPDTVPFQAEPEVGAVTVSQLKAIIAEWPELDEEGDPNQVWLATGDGLSSPCISVFQFSHMDIILEPDESVWKQTGGSDVA